MGVYAVPTGPIRSSSSGFVGVADDGDAALNAAEENEGAENAGAGAGGGGGGATAEMAYNEMQS